MESNHDDQEYEDDKNGEPPKGEVASKKKKENHIGTNEHDVVE